MAISPKTFRTIDRKLGRDLGSVWESLADDYIAEVVKEVARGVPPERAVEAIDLSPLFEETFKDLMLMSQSAVLFGAAQARSEANNRVRTTRGDAKLLDNAIEQFRELVKGVEVALQQRALKAIYEAEKADLRRQDPSIVRKQLLPEELTEFMNAGVRPAGFTNAQLIATLHTSRLGSYGFFMEAETLDLEFYEISEVLDSLTCPVCRRMDGMVFPTEQGRQQIDAVLSSGDVDMIRSIAPWQAQSQQALREFERLGPRDLLNRGIIMPPFHPFCRGILKRTTKTFDYESPTTLVTPAEQEAAPEADQEGRSITNSLLAGLGFAASVTAALRAAGIDVDDASEE